MSEEEPKEIKEKLTYNQYMKGYYHANKEKINVKIHCEICNKSVFKKTIARHKSTNYHKKNAAAM
jgi:hypothetical protein